MNLIPGLPLSAPELRWYDDLDSFAAEVASDYEALTQDVYHMLIENPGENLDDPQRGIGVPQMLSGNAANLATICARIDSQLVRDPRIDASKSTLTPLVDGNGNASYFLEVQIAVNGAVITLQYSYTSAGGLVSA